MTAPFLTPPSTSETVQCRTLITPNNKEWLGVFNSALLELINPYNWEQVNNTDLTIEEAIAIIEPILADFFATPECAEGGVCIQPSGNRIIRLGAGGHFEQMENGGWVEPTGDYTVPPVPERGEPTPEDRMCAAAANAENVLATLYEVVSDAVAEDLDEAETIALMVALLLAAVGLWLALAVEAIIWLTYALFVAFLEIAEYMTSDLWDAEFSQKLRCLLLACASDDGNVVTFDFNCVNEGLAEQVDLGGIDALNQLRLFGQVSFMLGVIGADGLNAAGATTAIEDANCEDCGECGDCTIEAAITTSFVWASAFPQGGWIATPTDYYDASLLYIRLEANGGNLFTHDEPACIVQIGASGINRFPGYPSLQLYALIEGVEYVFDGSNNVILPSPVTTSEVLLYIKEGGNGYMSMSGFSISWCPI